MSCADAEPLARAAGGAAPRRAPAESRTPKVRFERPPEIRSKLSGGSTSGTFASNQPSTPARSMPSGRLRRGLVSLLLHAQEHMTRSAASTSAGSSPRPVWDSFAAFCRDEGLEPDAIKKLFRTDPEALEDLRGLETGEIERVRVRGRLRPAARASTTPRV